jgi:cobalamin biosynthesis protein CobD/CbiB
MSSGQQLLSGAARAWQWFFGFLVVGIGLINTCWGNDPGFGVFLLLLALVFFPPVAAGIQARTGLGIPAWLRVVLGLFILWASLGVGELFDKIELMLRALRALV